MGSPVPTNPFAPNGVISPALAGAVTANPLAAESTYESTEANSITEQYTSAAEQLTATGDTQEAGLYGQAAEIAGANALTALDAGQIKEAQDQLEINGTIGSQRAAVASNGFAEAGSAVDMLRSSIQQGNLDKQLDIENSDLQAGAFYEQQSASSAEESAAQTAASVATTTAAMASQLSTLSATYANNEATAIKQASGPGANNPLLAGTPGHYII